MSVELYDISCSNEISRICFPVSSERTEEPERV